MPTVLIVGTHPSDLSPSLQHFLPCRSVIGIIALAIIVAPACEKRDNSDTPANPVTAPSPSPSSPSEQPGSVSTPKAPPAGTDWSKVTAASAGGASIAWRRLAAAIDSQYRTEKPNSNLSYRDGKARDDKGNTYSLTTAEWKGIVQLLDLKGGSLEFAGSATPGVKRSFYMFTKTSADIIHVQWTRPAD